MTTQLSILDTSIRTLDNLYSLNDLHLASGNDPKHRPSLFVRNEQTKELVKEIESENTRSTKMIFALKSIRGGKDISIQGTWACEELVLSYAMWISPKFHLVVLRAFLAMHKGEVKQQQLALPEPEKKYTLNWTESDLKHFASFWCATYEMHQMLKHLESGLRAIGSNFASTVYTQVNEYQSTLDLIHARLQVDIAPLQYTEPENRHWQYCLNTINRYKPKSQLRKNNF